MSVEPYLIAAVVEDGNPKPLFRAGVAKNDFVMYSEEMEWIEKQFENRKTITWRKFLKRFPDFERLVISEPLDQLIEEFKNELAYSKIYSLIESVSETLLPDNAVDQAEAMREVVADVVKAHSPHSEISVKDAERHYERMRQKRLIAKAGQPLGMPVGIPSLDFNWDGFVPGRMIGVIGRPGHFKSLWIAYIAWVCTKSGTNAGLFSPEMNEDEHMCRLYTLASHEKFVQKAIDIDEPFKNRDLMRGTGFDIKAFRRLTEFFDSLPGNCHIFTKKYRRTPISLQYVSSRVEDLGLHGVIADPLTKLSTGAKYNDNPVWDEYKKVGLYQEMAEEHNIWVVATNWANRKPNSKREDAPGLDDSFGSDALAKECDHVIGLAYDAEDRTLSLRCTKSRFGVQNFRITMDFYPNTGKVREINIPQEVLEHGLSTDNGTCGPLIGTNKYVDVNGNGNGHHKVSKKNMKRIVKAAKKPVKKAGKSRKVVKANA